MDKFNIEFYQNGRPMKYGNCYGLSLEDAVEELMTHGVINEGYTKEQITEVLTKMNIKLVDFGTPWNTIMLTKIFDYGTH